MENQSQLENQFFTSLINVMRGALNEALQTIPASPQKDLKYTDDLLLSVPEACEYLRCSRSKLNRLMKKGLLFKKLGRSTLFLKTDLDNYLKTYSLNQF